MAGFHQKPYAINLKKIHWLLSGTKRGPYRPKHTFLPTNPRSPVFIFISKINANSNTRIVYPIASLIVVLLEEIINHCF